MLRPKSRTTIGYALLITFMFCVLAGPAVPGADAVPIVKEDELKRWGYRTIDWREAEPSAWSIEKFGRARQYVQKIKSIKPVPDWTQAYYRFTLTQWVFPTAALAEKRLKHMKAHPQGVNTKKKPEYLLRDGFRIKECVIFVSTDVLKFKMEQMAAVVKQLKAYKAKSL